MHLTCMTLRKWLTTRRWASQRIVFGKPLMSQAVIRNKFARMIAKVEALQAWLENVTYNMCHMVSGLESHLGPYHPRFIRESGRMTLFEAETEGA